MSRFIFKDSLRELSIFDYDVYFLFRLDDFLIYMSRHEVDTRNIILYFLSNASFMLSQASF